MKRPYRALGRDLYFGIRCNHCPGLTLNLTGYSDDHFFDVVNAQPRELECGCGRKITYQWFRDGVVVSFNDENVDGDREISGIWTVDTNNVTRSEAGND